MINSALYQRSFRTCNARALSYAAANNLSSLLVAAMTEVIRMKMMMVVVTVVIYFSDDVTVVWNDYNLESIGSNEN